MEPWLQVSLVLRLYSSLSGVFCRFVRPLRDQPGVLTMPSDLELANNHLRAAVRTGSVMIAASFIIGAVGGSGISLWSENRPAAVVVILAAVIAGVWLTWAYRRTAGLMHHTGWKTATVITDQ
jgi:hypothetical protein